MHHNDWAILIFTILFIVIYGAYKTRDNKNIQWNANSFGPKYIQLRYDAVSDVVESRVH